MKILSSKQMKNFDKKTIEEIGIESLILMERASFGVFDYVYKNLEDILKNKDILILAGIGNNGADALALARMFFLKNINLKLVFCGDKAKRTKENIIQSDINTKLGIKEYSFEEIKDFKEFSIIIDGLFGVGLSRNLDSFYTNIINQVNDFNGIKIALDIPSGINADTGEVMETAFISDYTFTFGFYKKGLFTDNALNYVGKVILVDIGIPNFFADEIKLNLLTKEKILQLLITREKNAYKNKFGRVLLIGGSESMSGALVLATKSALRSGAGLVNVVVEKEIHNIVASQCPSAMVSPYSSFEEFEKKFNELPKFNSIVFGTGIGKDNIKKEILKYLIKNFQGVLVIDADGLNLLAENITILLERKYPTTITPHLGEFSRLSSKNSNEIKKDIFSSLEDFMKNKNNLITILKGGKTIITNGDESYINDTGNPIFARGGSGDILSGLLGGLSAYLNPFEASLLGVYLHGLAGDLALNDFSEHSILPEELVEYISKAFFKIS